MDNQATMRCAAYARFSSDNQREASIHDQLRKCNEYAESKGWTVLNDHIYTDEALSGAGCDRPGLSRMIEVALKKGQAAFDVILVDDTSRLSRNLGDVIRMIEQLTFQGVRVVAVSQGIDSADEQASVMFTVHGLVDSLYIKELAKKTHRGLEGLALQGLHTGGRTFGYMSVEAPDNRKQLAINEAEAKIVARIFNMRARGTSLKKIAKKLNEERILSPRPGTRKQYDTWCPNAIREMLRRELYVGVVVWNKRKYIKTPGSNKRVSRPRPQSEWKTSQRQDLRIISDEVWAAVQKRNDFTMATYSEEAKERKGLAHRAESSNYILSGLLKCGLCGAHMVIISGRAGKWARYGCSQHWNRGTCQNDLTINRQVAEETLLQELQEFSESKDGIEHVFCEFSAMLKAALDEASDGTVHLQERKRQLEAELERLTTAIRQGVSAKSLKKAISDGERELGRVEKAIKGAEPFNLDEQIALMRKFAVERIHALPVLFREDPSAAKWELRKRLGEVWMTPVRNAEGDRYFIGVGRWNLIEDDVMSSLSRVLDAAKIQQISGGRFLAGVPTIGSSDNTNERLTAHFWDGIEKAKCVHREEDTTALGMSSWLQNRNATGVWLNCGVRNVAGAGFEPATFGL